MTAMDTSSSGNLIRSELWDAQLEEVLHEMLLGVPFVREVDFPDGTTHTIVSFSGPTVRDLPEGAEATFDAFDTGETSLTLNPPVVAATSLSKVLMEDALYGPAAIAAIPGELATAIMERYETDVLALANSQASGTGNANNINSIAHRRIAGGTNETMRPQDFALARYALKKAKIPEDGLLAIVDPSVAYALETATNLVNVSNNPHHEGIIESGITNRMRFIRNVFGFDVFESNLIASSNETIGGDTTASGKANMFMAAGNKRLLPLAVAWRRKPDLMSEFVARLQETQILATARYGMAVVRDENLVVIVSDDDQVS